MEEDIKRLKELIQNANIEDMDMNDCFGGEHLEAIENILNRLEQLEEYLERISQDLDNVAIDQIPIAIAELKFKLEQDERVIEEITDKMKLMQQEERTKVKRFEEMYRNCTDKFYKRSYRRSIDIANTKRQQAKMMLNMLRCK